MWSVKVHVIRSSPDLQDLLPYVREKSETELYQKALEIVCLARVWTSLEPFVPEKKQQMMVKQRRRKVYLDYLIRRRNDEEEMVFVPEN